MCEQPHAHNAGNTGCLQRFKPQKQARTRPPISVTCCRTFLFTEHNTIVLLIIGNVIVEAHAVLVDHGKSAPQAVIALQVAG